LRQRKTENAFSHSGNGISTHITNGHAQPIAADQAPKEEIVKIEQLSCKTPNGSLSTTEGAATGLYDICPECGGSKFSFMKKVVKNATLVVIPSVS